MERALLRKKPVGRIASCRSSSRVRAKSSGSRVLAEKPRSDLVHLLVRTLGREDGGDQELKGVSVVKSGL